MAEWKKEIARLARDFNITRDEILNIFRRTEELYSNKDIPAYYKGNRNDFLYDKVHTEIMNIIFA